MFNPEKTTSAAFQLGDPPLLVFKGCGRVLFQTNAFSIDFRNANGDSIPLAILNGVGGYGGEFKADAEIYVVSTNNAGVSKTVDVFRWF